LTKDERYNDHKKKDKKSNIGTQQQIPTSNERFINTNLTKTGMN